MNSEHHGKMRFEDETELGVMKTSDMYVNIAFYCNCWSFLFIYILQDYAICTYQMMKRFVFVVRFANVR